jgi:hypothetical protein
MSANENILLHEQNKGNYKLQIIAQFTNPIRYLIRIQKPNGEKSDYASSLEGFKQFGELLLALNKFAEEKLYARNPDHLKELLTAENIKTYVKLKEAANFKR